MVDTKRKREERKVIHKCDKTLFIFMFSMFLMQPSYMRIETGLTFL